MEKLKFRERERERESERARERERSCTFLSNYAKLQPQLLCYMFVGLKLIPLGALEN
jgi:hypothetical protein